MKDPLVSIIIPTFNRAKLIPETLNSIINQTYLNWECLVIDDGSLDDTNEVLKRYAEQDHRIKYFIRPDNYKKGPSGCRNFGFNLSKGKYINWFDSDDLMELKKLEKEVKQLDSTNYDFTISQTVFFDHDTKDNLGYWNPNLFSNNSLNDFILLNIGWSTNAPLWKKSSLLKHGIKFNENLFGPDDYDYHIQVLKYGLVPKVIDEVHVKNRVHPNRIENNKNKALSKSIIVLDLLKNKESLHLSEECINKQYAMCFYLLKNMYKHKRVSQGFDFSRKLYSLDKRIFKWIHLIRLFGLGLIYKTTNRGYGYFNKF